MRPASGAEGDPVDDLTAAAGDGAAGDGGRYEQRTMLPLDDAGVEDADVVAVDDAEADVDDTADLDVPDDLEVPAGAVCRLTMMS